MDDARPNGKGDQAEVLIRIASGNEQEDAQGRVNGNDHLEIFRPSAGPGPPRWPEDRKWVEGKKRNTPGGGGGGFEVIKAFDFSHRAPAGIWRLLFANCGPNVSHHAPASSHVAWMALLGRLS